jgi:hypothetical protein
MAADILLLPLDLACLLLLLLLLFPSTASEDLDDFATGEYELLLMPPPINLLWLLTSLPEDESLMMRSCCVR